MISDDETNFSHRLFLTDRQVASLFKTVANKPFAKNFQIRVFKNTTIQKTTVRSIPWQITWAITES